MVTMEDIMKALKECYDPEIPVNVWDLGLIYDVAVDDDKVHVKMTLTAPGCPMHSFISQEVKEKLQTVSGVKEATVEVVWDPPWSPDKMSPEAKAQLGMQ
ncbi:iron-sulfur cluster assembly protein [Candidatus Bathyarchaeota archaeon]|nr:iron-sulfur cluster assembly protein [Candidatus Bathyarchaeota archaeon]